MQAVWSKTTKLFVIVLTTEDGPAWMDSRALASVVIGYPAGGGATPGLPTGCARGVQLLEKDVLPPEQTKPYGPAVQSAGG